MIKFWPWLHSLEGLDAVLCHYCIKDFLKRYDGSHTAEVLHLPVYNDGFRPKVSVAH